MNLTRKRRLYTLIFLLLGLGLALSLLLYALRSNISLYYTPTQLLAQGDSIRKERIRLGGLVVKGSVQYQKGSLYTRFTLTDFSHEIRVSYEGVLPALFHEGQGIVAEGHLMGDHAFLAETVLAKHDENYHPPGIPLEGGKT